MILQKKAAALKYAAAFFNQQFTGTAQKILKYQYPVFAKSHCFDWFYL
jgi:hypothetical protein